MNCPNCGSYYEGNIAFCAQCGAPLKNVQNAAPQNNGFSAPQGDGFVAVLHTVVQTMAVQVTAAHRAAASAVVIKHLFRRETSLSASFYQLLHVVSTVFTG